MRCKLCGGETDVLHEGVCFDCAAAPQNAVISATMGKISPTPVSARLPTSGMWPMKIRSTIL